MLSAIVNHGLKEWYEVTADYYNYNNESWSYNITRSWFITFNEAKAYYLYHPEMVGCGLYSNLHIQYCKRQNLGAGIFRELVL